MGSAAGGGFDIYARALARHWGKFIPGIRPLSCATCRVPAAPAPRPMSASVAPKDGTVLAAPMPGAIVGPLLEDNSQAGFDPAKLQYLGTADSGVRVCVTMDKSKVKTFADAQTQRRSWAPRRPVDRRAITPIMHRHTSGAKFDVVMGYQA